MSTLIIEALERTIKSGTRSYPIYIGFLQAEDLLKVAKVPNFKDNTDNCDIASNILNPPVKQWQRPLDPDVKASITATFDGTGEFMPNPVLVSVRATGTPPEINITNVMASGSIPTKVKEITVQIPSSSSEDMPLWIIDGQHRINGLGDASCKQKTNPIPVVLLLNSSGTQYNGKNLAKIFAQVTTEATPLKELHKEWLTFAFNLGEYDRGAASLSLKSAMQSVAHLCKEPDNRISGNSNCLHDDIKFNDSLLPSPKHLGMQYHCNDIARIISKHYYDETPSTGTPLSPHELADQISLSFEVLKKNVSAPQDKTVFFGKGNINHKIICDAFLIGVLTYLLKQKRNPTEADWDSLLKLLAFPITDWNFYQHVNHTQKWVPKSQKLAFSVFKEIFGNASLPSGVSNIWDYLSGDQLEISLVYKHLNTSNNPIKKNSLLATYGRGQRKTVPMAKRKYFKVYDRSVNAQNIEIFDNNSNPGSPTKFKWTGEKLIKPRVDSSLTSQNPLVLQIKITLYGGNADTIILTLSNYQ